MLEIYKHRLCLTPQEVEGRRYSIFWDDICKSGSRESLKLLDFELKCLFILEVEQCSEVI